MVFGISLIDQKKNCGNEYFFRSDTPENIRKFLFVREWMIHVFVTILRDFSGNTQSQFFYTEAVTGGILLKRPSKFIKFHRKTAVPESLF